MIRVQLASTLRDYCGGVDDFTVQADCIQNALSVIESTQPNVYRSICDDNGAVRRHINLFVNSDLVASKVADGLNIPLNSGDVLSIWPAVSGG